MTRLSLLLAVLGSLLLPGMAAATTVQPTTTLSDHLDECLPQLMERYEVPGVAIAVVQDGVVTWTQVYGVADASSGRALEPGTLFRAESLSKPIAAATVFALVEEGLIGLDDTLASHVPDWPFPAAGDGAAAVTIRQLLAHRAGLQLGTIGIEFAPDEPRPSLREHLADEAVLVQPPDEGFVYSNPGYDLLELLVEEVTGSDFDTVAEDRVLLPLEMTDAGFVWDDVRAVRLASGHELDGATVTPYVYATSASGGLLATVDDLGRFAAALATPTADDAAPHERAVTRLLTPTGRLAGPYRAVADRQGLGVFLETLPDGRDAAFSGGQGHGWMTHLHVLPGSGDGIVILTNSQRSWPLIAHVLTDWAEWAGAGTVGMGRILTATRLLWIAIATMLVASVWQGWRVVRRVARRTDTGSEEPTGAIAGRTVQGAIGLAALGVLVWAGQQDYLFVTSVFPAASPWLGVSIGALGVVLVASAAFPATSAVRERTISEHVPPSDRGDTGGRRQHPPGQ
jgi:CubicO group peptidase (beta-lactamase class C family)